MGNGHRGVGWVGPVAHVSAKEHAGPRTQYVVVLFRVSSPFGRCSQDKAGRNQRPRTRACRDRKLRKKEGAIEDRRGRDDAMLRVRDAALRDGLWMAR